MPLSQSELDALLAKHGELGDLLNDLTPDVPPPPPNTPPLTSGIADVSAEVGDPPLVIDLHAAFADAEDSDTELVYSVVGVSWRRYSQPKRRPKKFSEVPGSGTRSSCRVQVTA